MNIPSFDKKFSLFFENDSLRNNYELQCRTLKLFSEYAKSISGNRLKINDNSNISAAIEKNFFSVIFLSVIKCLTENDYYMPLYAFLNQSMRAWVTACDNILDDEYKEIFSFDLKEKGEKMRSVFTLMLADRMLCSFIMNEYKSIDLMEKVLHLSFQALIKPGLQECLEEIKPLPPLSPDDIIKKVHKRKTADIFTATLIVPQNLESIDKNKMKHARNLLHSFGLGCQILDDIKDVHTDFKNCGYNIITALENEKNHRKRNWTDPLKNSEENKFNACEIFPDSCIKAQKTAIGFFYKTFDKMNKIGLNITLAQRNVIIELLFKLLKVDCLIKL